MALFALDGKELLKIVKRGAKYYVYRLLDITISRKGTKFRWESRAVSISHPNSKKYIEERAVLSSPDVYIDDIRRRTPHRIFYE